MFDSLQNLKALVFPEIRLSSPVSFEQLLRLWRPDLVPNQSVDAGGRFEHWIEDEKVA